MNMHACRMRKLVMDTLWLHYITIIYTQETYTTMQPDKQAVRIRTAYIRLNLETEENVRIAPRCS